MVHTLLPDRLYDEASIDQARAHRRSLCKKMPVWDPSLKKQLRDKHQIDGVVLIELLRLMDAKQAKLLFYCLDESTLTRDSTTIGVEPRLLNMLRALDGPNGYAVYRALLAQKE